MEGEEDTKHYCEHPQMEVHPTNSMWGGAECYCSVCGHQWYATQKEIDGDRAARTKARPTSEVRHAVDPISGKTVEIRNDLKRRLLGYYASGPTMENGEPEFGWRKLGEPKPIEIEAAASLQALEERNAGLVAAVLDQVKETELYRSRWLSCVTPEEAKRLREINTALESRNKELEGALEPFTVKPGPLNSWLVMEATTRQHSNWVVEKDARDEAAELNARAALHPATKTGEA